MGTHPEEYRGSTPFLERSSTLWPAVYDAALVCRGKQIQGSDVMSKRVALPAAAATVALGLGMFAVSAQAEPPAALAPQGQAQNAAAVVGPLSSPKIRDAFVQVASQREAQLAAEAAAAQAAREAAAAAEAAAQAEREAEAAAAAKAKKATSSSSSSNSSSGSSSSGSSSSGSSSSGSSGYSSIASDSGDYSGADAWAASGKAQSVIQCESGGNYSINTGNGYYGAWQFDQSSWLANGGGQYASLPSQASASQQNQIAYNYYQNAGWRPWACG